MNIYRIRQDHNMGYETYDSAIVTARTEEEAKLIHPDEYYMPWDGKDGGYSWCPSRYVEVDLLGTTCQINQSGVILASFNAA